jgi:hypothetical protein
MIMVLQDLSTPNTNNINSNIYRNLPSGGFFWGKKQNRHCEVRSNLFKQMQGVIIVLKRLLRTSQ